MGWSKDIPSIERVRIVLDHIYEKVKMQLLVLFEEAYQEMKEAIDD